MLSLQSLGPKKVAFLWSHFQCCTVADIERIAKEGKLRDLAGFGEKSEQNILKAVEVFKKSTGRFLTSTAEDAAAKIGAHILRAGKLVESVTPAGSLRRGKETVGDLDLLVTLSEKQTQKSASTKPAKGDPRQAEVDALAEHILKFPAIDQVLAHGENKVSFTLANGLQVDVRLLEKENFGAALLYFTGSKEHNVKLRGRANDMGYTLNEYELATLPEDGSPDKDAKAKSKSAATAKAPEKPGKGVKRVAGRTEEEIYAKLKLDYIPPELRENSGEIEAAEKHTLPKSDRASRYQRRPTDAHHRQRRQKLHRRNGGSCQSLGPRVHRHHRPFQSRHCRQWTRRKAHAPLTSRSFAPPIKRASAFASSSASKSTSSKMATSIFRRQSSPELDVVVCSVHSYFNLDRAAMTDRMLAAIENPYTQIIGHPTGRLLLRRDAFDYDMEKILDACAKHGVAMECNSYPDRLDLKDVYLRMCKDRGVKVVISTDSHSTTNLNFIGYGVTMARRGWLEKKDVINTCPVKDFLSALRKKK